MNKKNITISLRSFDLRDFENGWSVKSIIDNPDLFDNLYDLYPLVSLKDLDDYYIYLLSRKLDYLSNLLPAMLQEDHKAIVSRISDKAKGVLSSFDNGDVIRFINENIRDIFDKSKTTHDMRYVTLDLISKFSNGINKEVFEYLCQNDGYLLIDRFDEFEKVFEKYPELFEIVYPTGHMEEIEELRLNKTLEIWSHIVHKKNSNLKETVMRCVPVLADDMKTLCDSATTDNIIRIEKPVREFYSFLQQIHSPLANEFSGHTKKMSIILSESIVKNGKSFEFEIPVKEIIDRWKVTENPIYRMMLLTHDVSVDNGTWQCISRLSKNSEGKTSIIDYFSTNIPTDDFFTVSHQNLLSVYESIGSATMSGILNCHDYLIDYLNHAISEVGYIADCIDTREERLPEDCKMLSALLQLTATNMKNEKDILQGLCYATAMYLCSFSEKIMRVLYIYLVKDEQYIPLKKATMGELLSPNNNYMKSVFGEDHIKNLSFFLQQDPVSNVGQNIRNRIAHWANVSTQKMTPYLVAKILWLFTDILNTVFWYCLAQINEE